MPANQEPGETEEAAAATFDLRTLPASFYANPYPTYHALRRHDPVRAMPDGTWFLTRHADLMAIYGDPYTFSSDKHEEFGPKDGQSPLFEARVAISRFLARFPSYEPAGPAIRGGRARFRGFLSIPVKVQ